MKKRSFGSFLLGVLFTCGLGYLVLFEFGTTNHINIQGCHDSPRNISQSVLLKPLALSSPGELQGRTAEAGGVGGSDSQPKLSAPVASVPSAPDAVAVAGVSSGDSSADGSPDLLSGDFWAQGFHGKRVRNDETECKLTSAGLRMLPSIGVNSDPLSKKELTCGLESFSAVASSNGNSILTMTCPHGGLFEKPQYLETDYSCVLRNGCTPPEEAWLDFEAWARVGTNASRPVTRLYARCQRKIGADFVYNYHFVPRPALPKEEARQLLQRKQMFFGDTRPPNVYVIILDSVSRAQFSRAAPLCREYLGRLAKTTPKTTRLAQWLRYSAVGWSTTCNVNALVSGCAEIPGGGFGKAQECKGHEAKTWSLLDFYAEMGYHVLGGQNMAGRSVGCHFGKWLIERQVDLAIELMANADREHPDLPHFMLMHNDDNHVFNQQGIFTQDAHLRRFLQHVDHANSVLLLVADHGHYYGPGPSNLLDMLDANNPLGMLLLPLPLTEQLGLAAGGEGSRLLDANEQQLVTHWDMHRTLKQLPVALARQHLGQRADSVLGGVATGDKGDKKGNLLERMRRSMPDLSSADEPGSPSRSYDLLFERIPGNRTCRQAHSAPGFCLCEVISPVDRAAAAVREAEKAMRAAAIAFANAQTGPLQGQQGAGACARLRAEDFVVAEHVQLSGSGKNKAKQVLVLERAVPANERAALMAANNLLSYRAVFDGTNPAAAQVKEMGRLDSFEMEECLHSEYNWHGMNQQVFVTMPDGSRVEKASWGKKRDYKLCSCLPAKSG